MEYTQRCLPFKLNIILKCLKGVIDVDYNLEIKHRLYDTTITLLIIFLFSVMIYAIHKKKECGMNEFNIAEIRKKNGLTQMEFAQNMEYRHHLDFDILKSLKGLANIIDSIKVKT